MKPTLKAKYIRDYKLKYQTHSDFTIARLLVKEHPMLFDDVEKTRNNIRYYKGALGNKNRKAKTAFYGELRKQI